MKAIIKNTKEIVEVTCVNNYNSRGEIINSWYHSTDGRSFSKDELEFIDLGENLDYWARLEHQYAGMAMQGVLTNADLLFSLCKHRDDCSVKVVAIEFANACAHALVEKMKEEKK